MFPESEPSKIPLEAYLWSAPVRRLLDEIGWLQGGVVIVDKLGETQIIRLDVDLPWRALRLPVIRPLQEVGSKRMLARCFEDAWEEINRRAFLFPSVESAQRQRLLVELRDWIYHHDGAPEMYPGLARQELDGPMRVMAQKVSGHVPSAASDRRIHQALADHLAASAMLAHFVRLNRIRLKRRTSFLEFMNRERSDITLIARQNAVLWVPDGEISFLLLEYLSTTPEPVHIGGRLIHQNQANHPEISEEVFEGLGLLPAKTDLAKRMAIWVRDLLGARGYDPKEHSILSPLTNKGFWAWLKRKFLDDASRVDAVLAPLLEGRASLEGLRKFCMELSRCRTVETLEGDGPVNCRLALFQRWKDPTPRFILALQFSPWSKAVQTASRGPRRVAYFIGTFRSVDALDLNQQILLVRALVSAAQWPTMHNLLEEERAMDRVSYFFVHDLYNRVWDLSDSIQIVLREAKDKGDTTIHRRAADAFRIVQSLYGTTRLLADLQKCVGGQVPADWAENGRLEDWPLNITHQDLQVIANCCESVLLETIGWYLPEMELSGRHFIVRKVSLDEQSVLEETDARLLTRDGGSRIMPPFDPKRDEGPRAILATLVELVRNAVKGIIRDPNEYEHFEVNKALHLDYQIEVAQESVRVSLWDPIFGEKRPRPYLLERVRNLLFNNAVELSTPNTDITYPLGTQNLRWAYSKYEYFPARLKFRKERSNAQP